MTEYVLIGILLITVVINTIYGNNPNLLVNVIESARLIAYTIIVSTLLYTLNDAIRDYTLWVSVVNYWKGYE